MQESVDLARLHLLPPNKPPRHDGRVICPRSEQEHELFQFVVGMELMEVKNLNLKNSKRAGVQECSPTDPTSWGEDHDCVDLYFGTASELYLFLFKNMVGAPRGNSTDPM